MLLLSQEKVKATFLNYGTENDTLMETGNWRPILKTKKYPAITGFNRVLISKH